VLAAVAAVHKALIQQNGVLGKLVAVMAVMVWLLA
jgi:hypothetical protein